jgi:hypothetical protein
MLAIKLHKKPVPFLGRGSHLIPIMSWPVGERFLRNWVPMLNRQNPWRPNNQIHYITLVRIQDSTRLTLNPDWAHKDDSYEPFADLPQKCYFEEDEWRWVDKDANGFPCRPTKQPRFRWEMAGKEWFGQWIEPELCQHQDTKEPIGMRRSLPEIILGEKLDDRCILWTKDFRLLYQGNAKAKGESRKAKHKKRRMANWEDS